MGEEREREKIGGRGEVPNCFFAGKSDGGAFSQTFLGWAGVGWVRRISCSTMMQPDYFNLSWL